MRNIRIGLVCTAIFMSVFTVFSAREYKKEKINFLVGDNWRAQVHGETGRIIDYKYKLKNGWENLPFRPDSLGGLQWEGVMLKGVAGNLNCFQGNVHDIIYTIQYIPAGNKLVAECSIENTGNTPFSPERSRVILGINSEMHAYPEWDDKFFPTMMRCEKNFMWGYFMSPREKIVVVGCESPVASYGLNYVYDGWLKWKWGHQIKTASLDMIHCLPLPSRHPQDKTTLLPGERKTWKIYIGGVDALTDIRPTLASWMQVPMIHCSKYTFTQNESVALTILSPSPLESLVLQSPSGNTYPLQVQCDSASHYSAVLSNVTECGVYTVTAVSKNNKQAEAKVYVREPWDWYLSHARDFVVKNPPLFSNGCEAFYGYYTAFLGRKYFPDPAKDSLIENRFNRALPYYIDTVTWLPKKEAAPYRVQNFSTLIGMLVDLWDATQNRTYLEKASKIADYISSDSVQWKDGSYRSRGTHYTAVIYPAKSMLELVSAERTLIKDKIWRDRYTRHSLSAFRAIEDLANRLDDIQTEGDMTFEDGMITCSAMQIALQALRCDDEVQRKKYTEAAEYLMKKHQCLQQRIIPDCRMRGGTLRYWEALDVYFVPNQVMNSPHGWTAWKIYAHYYLYLLTGNVDYLSDFMDTLGACVQIMDTTGHLRWGFIPDPYVKGKVCVEKKTEQTHWQPVDSIVGEQYLELISPWLRPDDETQVCAFGERGGSGDNTVQEIFKALEECALTTAYVVIGKNGELQTWNAVAEYKNNILEVNTKERFITRIHINNLSGKTVILKTVLSPKKQKIHTGMIWIGRHNIL